MYDVRPTGEPIPALVADITSAATPDPDTPCVPEDAAEKTMVARPVPPSRKSTALPAGGVYDKPPARKSTALPDGGVYAIDYYGTETAKEEIRIGPVMTKFVVLNCIVAPPPVTPTSQSNTTFAAESVIRAHVAVPVASAEESWVMAENVSVPELELPHGSENVSVPRSVCVVTASDGKDGCVPL